MQEMRDSEVEVEASDSQGTIFFCPGCTRFHKYSDAVEFRSMTIMPFWDTPEGASKGVVKPNGWKRRTQPILLCVNCSPH